MADSSSSSSGGIGFAGLLTIVFVVLKLNPGGHLDSPVEDWSWWWVFSPLWISAAIFVGILAIVGLVMLGAWVIDKINLKRRRKKQLAAIRGRRPTR